MIKIQGADPDERPWHRKRNRREKAQVKREESYPKLSEPKVLGNLALILDANTGEIIFAAPGVLQPEWRAK